MARIQKYSQATTSPGGRSFYTNPRERTYRARAPITPALRKALAKRRKARHVEYLSALKGAQDTVYNQAVQLREGFGGHSAEYYTQEILQRGRLERSHRKPSRWNVFLKQQVKARNAGARVLSLRCVAVTQPNAQNYPPASEN